MSGRGDCGYDEVPPDAGKILESLRAVGYSLEMAIADIIDNSISAGAENIWFDAAPDAEYIQISDDGDGLTEDDLVESMRFGSKDPLSERELSDLGRFGLGLKTASFSHCRKLTVASKTFNSDISIRQWDLDYIRDTGEWRLLQPDINEYPRIQERLDNVSQGTVVYWENIDKLKSSTGDTWSGKDKSWYQKQILKVNNHLQMVFHRFLEDEDFTLTLPNNIAAKPWDPFLKDLFSTPLEEEISKEGIAIYPYVLPHRSKLTDDEYIDAKGPLGSWARAQGFYVYRGKRLITPGSWLGLKGYTKASDTDLARIQIDIANDEDDEWMLDVKKTSVRIPLKYKEELERVADKTRDRARKVKLYRGKVSRRETPGNYRFIWDTDKNRTGNVRYRINREHPVIEKFISNPGSLSKKDALNILRLIEETVPLQGIILEDMKHPDSVPEPFAEIPSTDIFAILESAVSILNLEDMSDEEKRRILTDMEPFSEHPELIQKLLNEV